MGTSTVRTVSAPSCAEPEDLSSISDRYGVKVVHGPADDLWSQVIHRVVDIAGGPPEWGDQVVPLSELRQELSRLLVKAWDDSSVSAPRWPTFTDDMDRAAAWIVLSILNHLDDCGLSVAVISRPAKPLAECWL